MKEKQNNPSLFGPLILIAIGVFWLLSNFNMAPALNWAGLFRIWPIFLILLGVNLIVKNLRRPIGSVLSGLVGLAAIGVVAATLLVPNGDRRPLEGLEATRNQPLTIPVGEARSAEIILDTGIAGANISVFNGGPNLIEGTVSYVGEFSTRAEVAQSDAQVRMGAEGNGWFMNPANWGASFDLPPWQLGLNGAIPTELRVDSGTGALTLDLRGADLTYLDVDTGTGAITARLPEGEYDTGVDTGTGSSQWYLPQSGRGEYKFDTGTGNVTLFLPDGMEARINFDGGTGRFSGDERFELIEGEAGDGIWQTADYERAANRLDISIDSGTGNVSVQRATGR